MDRFFAVITTIQEPTLSVKSLINTLSKYKGTLVVAGDKKGPIGYLINPSLEDTMQFLSLKDQLEGSFDLARILPTGHYSRKNIAYLHAITQGATCIYETDDDNAPLVNWQPRQEYVQDVRVIEHGAMQQSQPGRWVNVYKYFSDENIWPRGLPLDEIHTPVPDVFENGKKYWSPIQQGLVNGSPDVDAIWRLVQDHDFDFDNNRSVYLSPGYWSPFNTQSTWWWPAAYPLLYIPSYCSFRMCDIWKSFVAQRCLWELDAGVTFHASEVVQNRNLHNIVRDFKDELPGYENNSNITKILTNLKLKAGRTNVGNNLYDCYSALITECIIPADELRLVNCWLQNF